MRGTPIAVGGVRVVGPSLGVNEVGFREVLEVRMSLPRSHLGQVLGRFVGCVSVRRTSVWLWVSHDKCEG